ncbi:armet protein [Pelagophyceae sp. CCMP2097]|nr:armet protein [Pelagophyceae sp. CCMP2097]
MVRLLLLLLSAAQLSQCAKVEDPKECEVCISNLEQIEQLIDKDQKASKQSITEAISKHCGDLQNEKPNPALSQKDRKMCYYFEPIKAAIAQPFSTRMPKDRVCKRLKKENPEICQIKYAVVVETAGVSAEEMLAKLKKMRVKELKGILADRGAACDGCLEKDDFIKKIVETQGTEL